MKSSVTAADGESIPLPVKPTGRTSSAVGWMYSKVSESSVTPDVVAVVISSVSVITTNGQVSLRGRRFGFCSDHKYGYNPDC